MQSAEKSNQDNALVMVYLRNQFYRNKYYFALIIYLLSLIVIGFLVAVLIYLVKNPTHPLYFATDDMARLIQDTPTSLPNMSTDDVKKWVIEAVENSESRDFINYHQQLQNASKYFTPYGWRKKMAGLAASNNLLALTERKQVVIAKVVGDPVLIKEGRIGNIYAWKFQLAVLITYMEPPYNDKSQFKNALLEDVLVERQSILSSYKGLGILQANQKQAI